MYSLSHRETHPLTTNEVHVDVIHRLSRVWPSVDDQTVPRFGDSLLCCELSGDTKEMTHQHGIIRTEVVDGGDVLFRNYQDMMWCNRSNILEGNHQIVAKEKASRAFTGDDSAEDALFVHD